MTKLAWPAAAVFLLASLLGQAQTAAGPQKAQTPSERMDDLFAFWNRLDQPGFAALVVQNGQVLYQKAFGLACLEQPSPNTPKTIFHLAQASQPFTGQAVAILEKQGQLSLDDDVRKFFPEIPDFGTPLKVRHLLFQSSGLRDWQAARTLEGRENEAIDFAAVLDYVKNQKRLIFPPGSRSLFSASNYDLLAEIVKRVGGKPFPEWAWENIFKPLKMTRTHFRENSREVIENQALSYNFNRTESYLKSLDNLNAAGSFSLFSNLEDLAKWFANLSTGEVGGKDLAAKLMTAGRLDGDRPAPYGYGFRLNSYRGRLRAFQNGSWAGSGAVLHYYPDSQLGFVVLANWDYTPVEEFIGGILNIFAPPPTAPLPEKKTPPAPEKPKETKIAPAILDRYVGDYRLFPGQVYGIAREGDELVFTYPGGKMPLVTLSETEFFLAAAGAKITFQKNDKGDAVRFLWQQESQDAVIAPRVVLFKPTPAELQEYAGGYVNEELNIRYSVELRGGRLFLSLPGKNEFPLGTDEKDRFAVSSGFFRGLKFSRDGQDRITGFVIDNEAVRDLVFKRI